MNCLNFYCCCEVLIKRNVDVVEITFVMVVGLCLLHATINVVGKVEEVLNIEKIVAVVVVVVDVVEKNIPLKNFIKE